MTEKSSDFDSKLTDVSSHPKPKVLDIQNIIDNAVKKALESSNAPPLMPTEIMKDRLEQELISNANEFRELYKTQGRAVALKSKTEYCAKQEKLLIELKKFTGLTSKDRLIINLGQRALNKVMQA